MGKVVTHMRKVDRVIEALLTTGTVKDAAEKLGMHRNTLYKKYLNDPAFIEEFKRVRDERQRATVAKLANYATRALDVLMEIAEDEESPPHARVAAARGLVEQSMKVYEVAKMEELEERLDALERMEGRDNGTNPFTS